MKAAILRKFTQALLLLLGSSLWGIPTFAASCPTEEAASTAGGTALARVFPDSAVLGTKKADMQAALARLDTMRQSKFNTAPSPEAYGDTYGLIVFYANLSRQAKEPRQRELFSRAARDQFIRLASLDLARRQGWASGLDEAVARSIEPTIAAQACRTDAENLAWLKADLQENGWYRISIVGETASNAAWLLVQHADEELTFQQDVLAMLEPLVAQGETSKSNYALLFDRVAVSTGRLQRYGSSGRCSADRIWSPLPMEEPSGVDKRRAQMGLQPMAEYVAGFSAFCP